MARKKVQPITPTIDKQLIQGVLDKAVQESQEMGMYDNPVKSLDIGQDSPSGLPNHSEEANIAQNTLQELTEASKSVAEANIIATDAQEPVCTDKTLPSGVLSGYVIKRGKSKPVPAYQLTLRHPRLIDLIKNIHHIAALNGELDKTFLPRTQTPPFMCKMLLPEDQFTKYFNNEGYPEYDSELEYSTVRVSSVDRAVFVQKVISLTKQGAVLNPKKAAISTPILSVEMFTRLPMESEGNVQVEPKNFLYCKDELDTMSLEQLQAIGEKYSISNSSKEVLVGMIWEAQGALYESNSQE